MPRPDAALLTFDAAMLDTPAPDAGRDAGRDGGRDAGADAALPSEGTLCRLGTVGMTPSGTRTNMPHLNPIVFDTRYRLRTVNYVIRRDGDSRGPLLSVYVEVENASSQMGCTLIPRVYVGFRDLAGYVEAPPYFSTVVMSGVTDGCLSPGEVGYYYGVARGVDVDDLEAETYFSFDANPGFQTSGLRARRPEVDARVQSVEGGYAIVGNLRFPDTIRNYGFRAYARDDRGLVVARLLAFPRDLATIYAGSVVPFETSATPCEVTTFAVTESWIDDSRSSLARPGANPRLAELELVRERMRDLIEVQRD